MQTEFDTNTDSEIAVFIQQVSAHPELNSLDYSDLPTSPEIIAKGMRDLLAFRKQFAHVIERIDFLDDVFLGISPEQGSVVRSFLNHLLPGIQCQVITFLEKAGYVVTDLSKKSSTLFQKITNMYQSQGKITPNNAKRYSIINVKAAERVLWQDLSNNDSVFSSLSDGDKMSFGDWLKTHSTEWVIGDKLFTSSLAGRRLGLLSG